MGPAKDTDAAARQSMNLPVLKDDGSNWADYEPRMLNALGAKGLVRHVEGLATAPAQFTADKDGNPILPDGTKATYKDVEMRDEKIEEFNTKEYLARHLLSNSVCARLMHEIRSLTAKEMWAKIKTDDTKKSQLFRIDARKRMSELKCAEGDDMNAHLDKLIEIRDELHGMGSKLTDEEYAETIMESLSDSYRVLLVPIVHSATMRGDTVSSEGLIRVLREEAKHKAIGMCGTASSETMLATQKGKQKHKKTKSTGGKKCYNCSKEGHIQTDCWAEGGGKAGQGPSQNKKEKSASVAVGTNEDKRFAFACTSDCANVSLKGTSNRIEAVMDTGASHHFCPEKDKFSNFTTKSPSPIYAADGRAFDAIGEGDLICRISNGEETSRVALKNVIYAPDMANTLISVGRLGDAGLTALFTKATCKVQTEDGAVIATAPRRDRLYRPTLHFDVQPLKVAHAAVKNVSLADAHRILGHISYSAVRHLAKIRAVDRLEIDLNSPEEFCEACAQAKPLRKPFPEEASNRAKIFGERLIGDTWGPAQVTSIGSNRYTFDLIDDVTRWTNVEFVPMKKDLITRYKRYEAQIETEHGAKVKYLRVDCGTELKNKEFDGHLAQKGTKWEFTVHDTHEQVGAVERWNRTKIELARAMLAALGLQKNLWVEAVNHGTWLKNRLPTKALSGGTPFEGRYKKKPDLRGLVPFGTPVWVKIMDAGKLDRRAHEGRFVGYDMTSKGYRVYFPDKRTIGIEREVAFNPTDDRSFISP